MTTADLAAAPSDRSRADPQPRVLLIQGQRGTSAIWNRVREMLDALGLPVIVVDRPSDGRDGEAATDQFNEAARLSALLDDDAAPTVVVGHRLGAGIAAAMAVIAPRRVDALVLVAPALVPRVVTPIDRLLATRVVGPALSWLGLRAAGAMLRLPPVRRWIRTDRAGLGPAHDEDVLSHLTRNHTWRSLTTAQRHFVGDADWMQRRIGDITCPVVIVAGVQGRLMRPKIVSNIATQLPYARIKRVDAGHRIPFDHPHSVVSAVLDVLAWEYRLSFGCQPDTRRRNQLDHPWLTSTTTNWRRTP